MDDFTYSGFLVSVLFNMYTNNQLIKLDSRYFIYVVNIVIVIQEITFEEVETKLIASLSDGKVLQNNEIKT